MRIQTIFCAESLENLCQVTVMDQQAVEPKVSYTLINQLIVYTWKNRELEWYNAERRFIFACKSDDERT